MRFFIKGIQNRKQIHIQINAASISQARQKAKSSNITIIDIKEQFSPLLKKPKTLEFSQDLHQIAIMLESNLQIKDILESLRFSSSSAFLRKMYSEILASLNKGATFSEALSVYKKIFSPMGLALIDSGIKSGKLAQIFNTLASHFEALAILKSKFLKVLFYPIFVIISVCVAFLFIAWFVIPQFYELFASFDKALPLSTQSLIFISDMLQNYGVYILLGIAIVALIIVRGYHQSKNIFRFCHNVILHLPIISKLVIYKDFWAYFLSFFYLYQSGLDFSTTLNIASLSISNPILKQETKKIESLVKKGKNLNDAFNDRLFFDLNVKNFIATAQKSSELEKMLKLCVKHYEYLYESSINKTLLYIEPIATILMALLVGWLAFGIFLPIWELGGVGLG